MGKITPMMRQYNEIKSQNMDSILFFRLGDFYEMFGEDAKTASDELDLVLTTRDRSSDNSGEERVPMCGVPYHSAESYIARLVAKGYKVAICEQVEDPAEAKGIVERAVIRVISPGTVIDASMLEEGRANYLCTLCYSAEEGYAACFADVSTGEICVSDFVSGDFNSLGSELTSYLPREILLSDSATDLSSLTDFLNKRMRCLVSVEDKLFDYHDARKFVNRHFSSEQTNGLSSVSTRAVGAILQYLTKTQKTDLSHIRTLRRNERYAFMELDPNTARNLELVSAMHTGEKRGSLLWVLDKTKTPMGRRLIRAWVQRPLLNLNEIENRLMAVSELADNTAVRGELMRELRSVGDLERLIARVVYGNANCRDLKSLSESVQAIGRITPYLTLTSPIMRECAGMDTLSDISELIEQVVHETAPLAMREGGMVKDGFDAEVDRLRGLLSGSTEALQSLEAGEREKTGKKLKIGYNRVFGYYIEIPRSSSDDVPEHYIRKQTLSNCERFVTAELKELENELLTAKDRLIKLEYDIIIKLCTDIAMHVGRVQQTSQLIAKLDVLCSFAETAVKNNYTRPALDESGELIIQAGRHPVVELMQRDMLFVANDTYLNSEGVCAAIITGPNMAGKSTYMRQTALIALMAQMGSFVPARAAKIGLTDRVFTRIGASDDLSSGKSTFMIEMTEVSYILHNATSKSLLILDEIGRGTSTYDGMSVARAVLEYCASREKLCARTLFATHYHELTVLEGELEGVINLHITAKKRGEELIFLRRISRGSAGDSYGIEVAGLAGVPGEVILRAKDILKTLEESQPQIKRIQASEEPEEDTASEILRELRETDIETISPIEAMGLLYRMKKMLENS